MTDEQFVEQLRSQFDTPRELPAAGYWHNIGIDTEVFIQNMLTGFKSLAEYVQVYNLDGDAYLKIVDENKAGSGALFVIRAIRSLEWSTQKLKLRDIRFLDQKNRAVFLHALYEWLQA